VRTATSWITFGECRVFSPGIYDAMPELAEAGNYFKSGKYLLRNLVFTVSKIGQIVTVGAPDKSANLAQAVPNPGCDAALAADAATSASAGATFYLDGHSRLDIEKGAVELHGAKRDQSWVSVHALSTSTRNAKS
jgi:hypothetical protein